MKNKGEVKKIVKQQKNSKKGASYAVKTIFGIKRCVLTEHITIRLVRKQQVI